MNKKWYEKTVWMVVLALIFFPVGGYLIWRTKDGYFADSKRKLKALPIFSIAWILLMIPGFISENKKERAIVDAFESGRIEEGLVLLRNHKTVSQQASAVRKYNDKIANMQAMKISAAQSEAEINKIFSVIDGITYTDSQREEVLKKASGIITASLPKAITFDEIDKLVENMRRIGVSADNLGVLTKAIEQRKAELALERPALSETAAAKYCKESIIARLKSPSSADFEENWFASAKIVQNTKKLTIYGYRSYVDAVNSFNAKLRTPFYCQVTIQKISGKVSVDLAM